MSRLLIILSAWIGLSAQAVDIVWLRLTPLFRYRDMSVVCSTDTFASDLYFGAEVEGGSVRKAVLKDRASGVLADQISFTASELKGVEFFVDPHGRRWLKNLQVSPRQIGWLLSNAGDYILACEKKVRVKTVGPAPYQFQFETAGLGESLLASDSQLATFKGQGLDDGYYVATLQLTQRQY